MRLTRNILFTILALVFFVKSADASPDAGVVQDDCQAFLHYGHMMVDDWQHDGIITASQADQANKRLPEMIGHVGCNFTTKEIDQANLTALQRFAGLITFTNILWVLAIIIGVVCFCIIFGNWVRQLVEIILHVPPQIYEFLLGFVGVGLVLQATLLRPGVKEYVAFTGCLLFGGALAIARHVHELRKAETPLFFFLALVSTFSALLHRSELNGFLATIAIMSMLGFSVIATPLCYCIGFRDDEDDSALGRATAAAFAMLFIYVPIHIFNMNIEHETLLFVFRKGALFMGSFVGYLGLLIASSKWYKCRTNYVLFQIITIAAGLAALAVGSIWQIPELQRIGGTFFILYIIEKFMEIPARSLVGWAWKGLLISGVIYAICMIIKTYPEALRPYLLF